MVPPSKGAKLFFRKFLYFQRPLNSILAPSSEESAAVGKIPGATLVPHGGWHEILKLPSVPCIKRNAPSVQRFDSNPVLPLSERVNFVIILRLGIAEMWA